VIVDSLQVDTAVFEERTGWALKPQGACKAEICVPLPPLTGQTVDVRDVAHRLGMPIVEDRKHGVWAIGPETIGRTLQSAEAPELVLPDRHGNEFRLSSLRGLKVFLLAWASW
jgi:hypothetical protein